MTHCMIWNVIIGGGVLLAIMSIVLGVITKIDYLYIPFVPAIIIILFGIWCKLEFGGKLQLETSIGDNEK